MIYKHRLLSIVLGAFLTTAALAALMNFSRSREESHKSITVLEEGGFKGGYILHTDDFDLDKSYRTVFRQEEDTLRELAAKILFQEEK